jgi:hypothetical protein
VKIEETPSTLMQNWMGALLYEKFRIQRQDLYMDHWILPQGIFYLRTTTFGKSLSGLRTDELPEPYDKESQWPNHRIQDSVERPQTECL